MSEFKKRGIVKVPNGTYKKDGIEKNRYNEVGILFATDNFNRMAIKLHNSASGEGPWLNIYLDEENDGADKSNFEKFREDKDQFKEKVQDKLPTEEEADKPINIADIPF